MSNRITKIKSRRYIHWSHVPTNENPADIGSRGCPASKIPGSWFQGPKWLPYKDIKREKEKELNVEAPLFRTKRTAAAIGEIGIHNTREFENADD